MALIKKNQIKESGEVFLERKSLKTPEAGIEDRYLNEDEKIAVEEKKKKEAQDVVFHARQEGERMKEEARKRGLEEGRVKGAGEVQEKLKEALETLNQAVKERKKIIKDAEAEILRLSLKAAEQIIRSEVSLHRDVCLNIVSEAINRISDREQVIIRVNREDAEYIKKYKDRLAGIVDGVKSFSVLEDNNIEPGGCVIETNLGYIDSRISTKLQAIEDAFGKLSSSGQEQ